MYTLARIGFEGRSELIYVSRVREVDFSIQESFVESEEALREGSECGLSPSGQCGSSSVDELEDDVE